MRDPGPGSMVMCIGCIHWARVMPSKPWRRPWPFGWCRAPLRGPVPFARERFGLYVLTHQTHGAECAAFKPRN